MDIAASLLCGLSAIAVLLVVVVDMCLCCICLIGDILIVVLSG